MNKVLTLRKGVAGLVMAFLLSSCGEADTSGASFKDEPMQTSDATLVYDVSDIDVAVLESAPLQILITARGRTRTGGWSEPALVLDEEASSGHLLVYQFVAVRPTGMATQALMPIEASVTYGPWRDRMAREIRVSASTNEHSIQYPGSESDE